MFMYFSVKILTLENMEWHNKFEISTSVYLYVLILQLLSFYLLNLCLQHDYGFNTTHNM